METKSKNRLKIGLFLVAVLLCIVAIYAGFQVMCWTYDPVVKENVTDFFHGIPVIACAGYCLYVCVKNIIRLRKDD